MRTISPHIIVAALAAATIGCGGAVGETLRPTDHTGNDALGGEAASCEANAKHARPLLVDWDPDARVDLEASMKSGIVVVKFDCGKIEVLSGCRVSGGDYGYAGVSLKEQVVQMKSLDDLHMNMPISSAKLGAEIQSGRSIDVALIMVGQRSTTVHDLSRDMIDGSCDGATHFVRTASVGAFAMGTGSMGKAAAAVELFGYGGGAESSSEKKALNKDGTLEACRKSTPDAPTPPSECQAPIRLQLVPIGNGTGAKKVDKKDKEIEAEENPCMPGYVFADGICTRESTGQHLCDSDDEGDCKAQCDKGHLASCLNYGNLLRRRTGDSGAAMPAYKKACDGDVADACAALALAIDPDLDDPDLAGQAKNALALAVKACNLGSAVACEQAGDYLVDDTHKIQDTPRALKLFLRGCNLGRGVSCWSASQVYFEGQGIPKNAEEGVRLLKKACSGGSPDECNDVAIIYTEGRHGIAKNLDVAFEFDMIACNLDDGYCNLAGASAARLGKEERAFALFQKHCEIHKDWDSCSEVGKRHSEGRGTAVDEAKARAAWKVACDGGDGDRYACDKIGTSMK